MLWVHHGNRLERLLGELVAVTAAAPADPFTPEVVAVQNQGMALWVAQRLAGATGISANLRFPLPAQLIWEIFRAWLPDLPPESHWDRAALVWRIMALLSDCLQRPAFAELAGYLAQGPAELKRYQLCRRVADVLDQYLVNRPEMVLGWEQGQEDHWQAELWRAIAGTAPGEHRAAVLARFRAAMASGAVPALPERVHLFGLTALAPAYLEVLGALAKHSEVHLFLLNPCQEYWADIVDEQGQARLRARARRAGSEDHLTALLDVGNPLLASMGHAGQEFLDQLLDLGVEDDYVFEPPPESSLLSLLQGDIHALRDRRSPNLGERAAIAEDDRSLQVHACHSPLREVQVLHDQLLWLLDHLESLEPREIVVMAPDIAGYAPYVEAVFGAAAEPLRIPWAVADQGVAAGDPLLEALGVLLELPASRLPASEVLSLLELPATRRRFGLDEQGLERIRAWVRESGIRWGLDGAMREGLGLPGDTGNTWEFGLQRLFLGYAMAPDAEPYAGVLPYADVEGGEAVALGALQELIVRLGHWRERLGRPAPADEWQRRICALLEDFFAPDEREQEPLQAVRAALDGLRHQAEQANLVEALSLEVVRSYLVEVLGDPPGARRFLTGRVTFCNMVPMRSIPFRVVCLLGMNDRDFPRSQRPAGFDLIARRPRRGDRSRRQDDRYLFLEALLSARDVLYLSYVGRDIRDNGEKVPTVLLGELLDYVERSFRRPDGDWPDRLVTHHPLQPFSRRYFDGSSTRLLSYAEDWLAAVRASTTPGPAPAFIDAPLDEPDPAWREVELEALIGFLCNPAAHFLRRRLGLRLPEEAEVIGDTEPFGVAGLERYQLRQALLMDALADCGAAQSLSRLRGQGLLPHGAPGELWLEGAQEEVDRYAQRLRPLVTGQLGPLEVDLKLGAYALRGMLPGLTPEGLLVYRLAKLKAADRLRLWVRHLALCVLAPPGVATSSRHLAEDGDFELGPAEAANTMLMDLLNLWWRGLREPLAFFPETSWQRVERGHIDGTVLNAWAGDHNPAPESLDMAVSIAFRGRNPLGPEFEALAEQIYVPLVQASTWIKADVP